MCSNWRNDNDAIVLTIIAFLVVNDVPATDQRRISVEKCLIGSTGRLQFKRTKPALIQLNLTWRDVTLIQ